jgi:hypothetical protein
MQRLQFEAETLQFFCVFTGKVNQANYNIRDWKVKKKKPPAPFAPAPAKGLN